MGHRIGHRIAVRIAFFSLLTLFFPVFSYAQSCATATVTGTVTDPNGLPYSNGVIEASISSGSPLLTCGNLPFANGYQRVSLSAAGTFSMQLALNSGAGSIQPSGTQWTFRVSGTAGLPLPVGTGTQVFSYTASISGNTDLSAALSALAPKLTNGTGGGGGSGPFSSLTSGTNTSAAMVVGTGASLSFSGSGTIAATTAVTAAALSGTPTLCDGTTQLSKGITANGNSSCVPAPLSVSNSDGTLTISPTTGAVVASLALAHANIWTGTQTLTHPVIVSYFVGALPAGPSLGWLAWVTDGASATDCTVGGGTTLVLCRYTGTVWAAYATAATSSFAALTPGIDSNPGTFGFSGNTFDLSAAAAFNLSQYPLLKAGSTPSAIVQSYTTDAAAGTISTGTVVKLNASGNVVSAGSSDTNVLGIATTTATAGTSINVAVAGTATCVFDNTPTPPDTVVISASVFANEECHDTGSTGWPSSGGAVVGRAVTSGGIVNIQTGQASATGGSFVPNPAAVGVVECTNSACTTVTALSTFGSGNVIRATGITGSGNAFFDTGGNLNHPNLLDYVAVSESAAPAIPSPGVEHWYSDNTTHQLTCQNSSGASCLPPMPGTGTQFAGAYWSATSSLGSVGPGKTGQIFTFNNAAAPTANSPGVADGNGGAAVTTTPYLIQCDSSTALLDRGTVIRIRSGASIVNVPLSSGSGCANLPVSLIDDGAGSITVQRNVGSTDTFTIVDGVAITDGATTFSMTNGMHATLTQGATGIWEVRLADGAAQTINGGAMPQNATLLGSNGSGQPIAAALPSADIFVGNGSNLPTAVAMSQDCTISNAGAMTCTKLQGGTITVPAAAGSATMAQVISSGTSALPTTSIASAACSLVTTAATGVATTDTIKFNPNVDPTGVTGYAPSPSGSLYIWPYPTAGNVNFKVCNNTNASITPAALTLNWQVTR